MKHTKSTDTFIKIKTSRTLQAVELVVKSLIPADDNGKISFYNSFGPDKSNFGKHITLYSFKKLLSKFMEN